MSPLIFNFPPINACIEFNSPLNIFVKSPLSMIMVHEATTSSPASLVTLPKMQILTKLIFMYSVLYQLNRFNKRNYTQESNLILK